MKEATKRLLEAFAVAFATEAAVILAQRLLDDGEDIEE